MKSSSTPFFFVFAERNTPTAECDPGEVERIVEEKTHDVNQLAIANSKKAHEVFTRLTLQNLEKSKEHKRRHYQGLLRWKRQRHLAAVELVLTRIESREFRLCPEFVAILERIRDKQMEVFEARKEMLLSTASAALLQNVVYAGVEKEACLPAPSLRAGHHVFPLQQ